MVMGDRPAMRDHRIGGGLLDRQPLLELLTPYRPGAMNVKYGAGPSG